MWNIYGIFFQFTSKNLEFQVSGTCASGFGACCVIYTSACGGTISYNTTYIRCINDFFVSLKNTFFQPGTLDTLQVILRRLPAHGQLQKCSLMVVTLGGHPL